MVSSVERGETSYETKNNMDNLNTTNKYLAVDPSSIPYMLINSVKEQQSDLEEKDERISDLENELNVLKSTLEDLIKKVDDINSGEITLNGNTSKSKLSQNKPNPFNSVTEIEYFIPKNTNKAEIQFFNTSGQLLKTYQVNANYFQKTLTW